jgi:outer membrane protein OmpA-like peptidoglycan-associated protein
MDVHNLCRAVLQAGSPPPTVLIRRLLVSLSLVALGACTSLPDALNPVEWAGSVDRYLSGDDDEIDPELAARVAAERAQPVPGGDEDFPSLSSVPDQAPRVTAYETREEITEGLIADRNNAQYVDNPAAGTLPGTTRNTPVPAPAPDPSVSSTPPVSQVVTPPKATSAASAPPLTVSPPPEIPTRETSVAPVSTPPVAEAPRDFVQAEPPAEYIADAVLRSTHIAVIYYVYGSKRLSDHDRAVLAQVAEQQHATGAVLRVVGHASTPANSDDPVEAKIANFAIALDRARIVATELTTLGVPANRIHVGSASDDQPAYSDSTASGEAANRRTDIYLDFYGQSG